MSGAEGGVTLEEEKSEVPVTVEETQSTPEGGGSTILEIKTI
jgi:hypothetical protein